MCVSVVAARACRNATLTSPGRTFIPFASALVRSVQRMLNIGVDAYSVSVSVMFSV